jgi:formylglycine-generating enzyme required for sulfatase activity
VVVAVIGAAAAIAGPLITKEREIQATRSAEFERTAIASQTAQLASAAQVAVTATDQPILPTATEPAPTSQPQAALPSELVLTLAPGVTMQMVRVPAGEFIMGSTDKDVDAVYEACLKWAQNCTRTLIEAEMPQFTMYLDEYLIGKTEVTVAQFAAFVDATGYKTTAEQEGKSWVLAEGKWEEVAGANWRQPQGVPSDLSKLADHPVTQVSWYDAVAFCKWAGEVTGHMGRWI